jgi:hypothetical protein
MGIDETGRNDVALGVNFLTPMFINCAYRDDPAIGDRNIRALSGAT